MSQRPSAYHASLGTPLLSLGGEIYTIGATFEGVAIWGAPGSGKSSGSARTLALAMLRAGYGGMVCCIKNSEADTWREYARETGRERDLIFIDASGGERFNILDYAVRTLAREGFEQNLVKVMEHMADAARQASDNGGGEDGRYFIDNALKWISHAFPLLMLAEGTIRLADLNRFIVSTPKSPEEIRRPKKLNPNDPNEPTPARNPAWEAWTQGYCAAVLRKASARADAEGPHSYAGMMWAAHNEFFLTEAATLDNRPRSSIESTLTSLIYPFTTGKLAELFCTTTTVTPEMARDGKVIVLNVPVLEFGTVGAVAQTLFKYMFGIAAQKTVVTKDTRPIFIFADEAQFVMNASDDDLLSTARSSKTALVYITQDMPTIYTRLGEEKKNKADALISKFSTRIFHANLSMPTNTAASELCGKVQKFHVGRSVNSSDSSGGGGNLQDHMHSFSGQSGASISTGETLSGYLDFEVPPDHFATKLRTGGPQNRFKVDAILVRSGAAWKRTGRHWLQVEFSQKA